MRLTETDYERFSALTSLLRCLWFLKLLKTPVDPELVSNLGLGKYD